MADKFVMRGPFDSGPLSAWELWNCGSAIPDGINLPPPPDLWDDEPLPPPLVERDGDVVTVHFLDVGRFRIDFSARTVTAFDLDPETAECVITHILHDHIAPRILAHLGELVLHASIVRIGAGAVVFLGETGSGKSTLATSLHMAGHVLLGDDAVIVSRDESAYMAVAVYPSLRLFPEVITRLIGDDVPTAPMADYSDKQNVQLPALAPAEAPVPLRAIIFLSDNREVAGVSATALDSTRACIKLIEQSFTLDPRDPACAARRLAAASQLALAVPAFTLEYPRDFARLNEVHAAIQAISERHAAVAPTSREENLVR